LLLAKEGSNIESNYRTYNASKDNNSSEDYKFSTNSSYNYSRYNSRKRDRSSRRDSSNIDYKV
jgi:hypothetical protein